MYAAHRRMSRARAATFALLTAALVFRVALALAVPNDEPDDGRLYARIGHNLVAHAAYSTSEDPPYAPTYIRVPGYPLFIAAVYSLFGDGNNTAVRVAQAVIDTMTCAIVALLAAAWTPRGWGARGRTRVRTWALAIAAACPFTAIYVVTILTETVAMCLGMFAVLLATAALARLRDAGAQPARDETADSARPLVRAFRAALTLWALTGMAAGATALVRPEFILYAGAAGVVLLLTGGGSESRRRPSLWLRRIVPGGLALTAGVVLVLAPWTVRNARQFGQFQPLNPRSVAMPGEFVAYGYARWVRTWIDHPRYVPSALFTVDLAPIRIDEMPAYAFGSEAERRRVAALLADYNRPAPDADPDEDGRLPPGGMTPAIDAGFDRLARERIAAHPLRYYLLLPARRAFSLWFDTHADFYPFAGYLLPVSGWNREEAQQVWLPIFAVLMAAWTVAGWAGAWRLGRHADTRMWLVLAVLLIVPRLALLSALENPEPRYTVEFFPLVSALAAIHAGRPR